MSDRKIVQIVTRPAAEYAGEFTRAALFVLCDDGTLWVMFTDPRGEGDAWHRLPPIPQEPTDAS